MPVCHTFVNCVIYPGHPSGGPWLKLWLLSRPLAQTVVIIKAHLVIDSVPNCLQEAEPLPLVGASSSYI